eukprot:gb/GEZJ01002239.1/.p1 GENE.gb/GEZJ01002239.1/~~gb/GEZJ01002239.1/.p1  ORF type:complete len:170 (-),score=2.61 gb/GEZJ01002239.1/:378-887(-)
MEKNCKTTVISSTLDANAESTKSAFQSTSRSFQSQDSARKHQLETRVLAPDNPFPTFKSHTLSEAGGSVWVSSRVILLWRLCCTCLFVFTLGLLAPSGQFNYGWFITWIYLGVTSTMILATISSLLYRLYPEQSSSIMSGRWSFPLLANSTVCTYQLFLSLSTGADLAF